MRSEANAKVQDLSKTLENEVDYGKEHIPIGICSVQSQSNNKQPLLIRRLRHDSTRDLTSIKLTNCLMFRGPTTQDRSRR